MLQRDLTYTPKQQFAIDGRLKHIYKADSALTSLAPLGSTSLQQTTWEIHNVTNFSLTHLILDGMTRS